MQKASYLVPPVNFRVWAGKPCVLWHLTRPLPGQTPWPFLLLLAVGMPAGRVSGSPAPLSVLLTHCCGLDMLTPPCPTPGPPSPTFHQKGRFPVFISIFQFSRGAARRGLAASPVGMRYAWEDSSFFFGGGRGSLKSGSLLNGGLTRIERIMIFFILTHCHFS